MLMYVNGKCLRFEEKFELLSSKMRTHYFMLYN